MLIYAGTTDCDDDEREEGGREEEDKGSAEMAAGNIELTREGGADRTSRKANGPDTETDML